MTAGRSPGEQAAADRPAGHDAHQQTAAELCPRPGCTPPPGGWCGLCPAIRRLIATAEQRGRDDEKRELREEIGLLKAALKRAYRQENELRTALADRTEATT